MRDKLWVGLLAGVVMVGSVYAQRDYSKVEIKPTKLADKIYMLEGSGFYQRRSLDRDHLQPLQGVANQILKSLTANPFALRATAGREYAKNTKKTGRE